MCKNAIETDRENVFKTIKTKENSFSLELISIYAGVIYVSICIMSKDSRGGKLTGEELEKEKYGLEEEKENEIPIRKKEKRKENEL